jgi:hypothetical protein
MNYLEQWSNDIISRPVFELKKEIVVKGIRKKHLGPRLEYAIIELKIVPSQKLEVELPTNFKNEQKEYIDASVFGLLDILLTAKSFPIKNIKIIFQSIDIHPVDSNIMAFRNAGRDAGKKIIDEIE